jgi:hypothetical protein
MASQSLRDDFASTVELYYTFIKKMKAANPQLNVSEVSFARGNGGKSLFGNPGSAGISNVSNAAVDDRFFEKNLYHALTPDQKHMLRLKRLKRETVINVHGGNGNGTGKGNGKGLMVKSLTRSILALATKFDKFSLLDYDDDDDYESSEEEEGTSNRSNDALTHQRKKKKRGGN